MTKVMRSLQIYILSLGFCSLLLGMMFPYNFPMFATITIIGSTLLVAVRKVQKLPVLVILYILIQLYYLVILSLYGQIYTHNVNDIANMLIVDLFIIQLFCFINNKYQFDKYYRNILNIIAFASVVVGIIGFYKFIRQLGGYQIQFFMVEGFQYPWGTSLVVDYNYYALGMISGLVAVYLLIKQSDGLILKYTYFISFLIIVLNILLCGSRRGWIVLFIILIALILKELANIFNIRTLLAAILLVLTVIMILSKLNIDATDSTIDELEKLRFRASTISGSTETSDSFSPRTERWGYALEMFDDYPLVMQVVGGGFNYLDAYGRRFSVDINVNEDYPHNPILSTLLYSGIVGTILLIVYFMFVTRLYIFSKKYVYFKYLFFINIIFDITSANTLFSIKLTMVLSITAIMVYKIQNNNICTLSRSSQGG